MRALIERVKDEPALVSGLVQALLGLLLTFGLPLTDEQVGAVMVLTAALLAFIVRAKVMPARKARRAIDNLA